MCGIVGIFRTTGISPADIETTISMRDTLIHRGPDSCGLYHDRYVVLGHRRLSIIDLSGGMQPMSSVCKRFHIVFNGEIYNFHELKKELEEYGENFFTNSDTEVLLYSYARWGKKCIERLNGMYAFALWDSKERKLFLARDRLGKKPIYYLWDGTTFIFASEMKSLTKPSLTSGEIDPYALDCFISLGYIPSPFSIFKDIKKLPPGSFLEVEKGRKREQRYWQVDFSYKVKKDEDELSEELEDLLKDAVKIRLTSDVPLGAFLSGGIDSTLVVSLMTTLQKDPVLTNTIGFEKHTFDETSLAKEVATALGCNHKDFILSPRIHEELEKIVWHLDEPFSDSSACSTWWVCKMARERVVVALSGDGGDESFGGYTFRYLPHIIESKVRRSIPSAIRRSFFGTLERIYPASPIIPRPLRLRSIFRNLSTTDEEAFYLDLISLEEKTKETLYTRDFKRLLKGFSPREIIYDLYRKNKWRDPLDRAQFTDINFYLPEDVLVKVDRMSMAHSLEVRSPLLDYRVIEFAATLPVSLRIQKGKGKILLRKMLGKRKISSGILKAPKRGFSIPIASWLRNELKDFVIEMLFSSSILKEVFEEKKLKEIWKEHQKRVRDHSQFLWSALNLTLWHNMIKKG